MILLVLACSPVTLTDDTRLSLDPIAGASLASPYTLGAQFDLQLRGPEAVVEEYTLVSTDEDVLELGAGVSDDDGQLAFAAIATGEGTTQLVVLDADGNEAFRGMAEVLRPSRAELRAATDLSAEEEAGALDAASVCVGGEALFRVDLFRGEEALAGAGGLAADTTSSAAVGVEVSSFITDHDWLRIAPDAAGAVDVRLLVAGAELQVVSMTAVAETDVQELELGSQSEAGAQVGDDLEVVAWGTTGGGERVYGVPVAWESGAEQLGQGDTLRYSFDPAVTSVVSALGASQEAQVVVHGVATVSDSDTAACAVANVGPVGAAIVLAMLGALRRRGSRGRGARRQ